MEEKLEQKHESDLTEKEKRELERRKMKSLGFKDRIEYVWTYYKQWLFGALLLIALICAGADISKSKNQEILVGTAVAGASADYQKELQQTVKEWIGSENKEAGVDLYLGLLTDPKDVQTRTLLDTWIASEAVDIVICPKEFYESYEKQETFADMREALGEQAKQYEELIEGNALVLKDAGEIKEKLGVGYDDIYIGIVRNGKHRENARAMILGILKSFSF